MRPVSIFPKFGNPKCPLPIQSINRRKLLNKTLAIMTLFVDCNNSKFSLIPIGNPPIESNLSTKDREAFFKHFLNESSFSGVIFKNLPEVGDGFLLFKSTTVNSNFTVHVRCTSQDLKSNCLLWKNMFLPPCDSFLPETVKSKAKRILECLKVNTGTETILKSVSSGKMKKMIMKMDSDLFLNRFKFGVAYLDRFDTSEQQMLSNTIDDSEYSEAFTFFLNGLGDKIELNGWKRFSGGLDVSQEGLTGQNAIYKRFEDSEMIFHISPWLPQSESFENLQNNLERKRHFGNDTIVIIYSESLYAFEMQSLLSRQIQVVIFVRYINRLQKYQIHIYSKIPHLCVKLNPFVIESERDFEEFAKFLISLERQIYNVPPFDEKISCMRTFHLRQIAK